VANTQVWLSIVFNTHQ